MRFFYLSIILCTESVSLFRELVDEYQLYERSDDALHRLAWLEKGGF